MRSILARTNDNIIMGITTFEPNESNISSSICVFDVNGKTYIDDIPFKGNLKYEGIDYFLIILSYIVQ